MKKWTAIGNDKNGEIEITVSANSKEEALWTLGHYPQLIGVKVKWGTLKEIVRKQRKKKGKP